MKKRIIFGLFLMTLSILIDFISVSIGIFIPTMLPGIVVKLIFFRDFFMYDILVFDAIFWFIFGLILGYDIKKINFKRIFPYENVKEDE